MHENLPTTLTNLPMLFGVYLAYSNDDLLTALCILFVASASFFSHLIENHKHGMSGYIVVSKRTSYALNRLDVIGCCIVITRYIQLIYQYHYVPTFDEVFVTILAFTLNIISERDKYNADLKYFYILIHSIWHLIAAACMYLILKNIYDS